MDASLVIGGGVVSWIPQRLTTVLLLRASGPDNPIRTIVNNTVKPTKIQIFSTTSKRRSLLQTPILHKSSPDTTTTPSDKIQTSTPMSGWTPEIRTRRTFSISIRILTTCTGIRITEFMPNILTDTSRSSRRQTPQPRLSGDGSTI